MVCWFVDNPNNFGEEECASAFVTDREMSKKSIAFLASKPIKSLCQENEAVASEITQDWKSPEGTSTSAATSECCRPKDVRQFSL